MKITDVEYILQLVLEDSWMMDLLRTAQLLQLPDWWICAGFVRSKVWDVMHLYQVRTPLPDIDVIYYDRLNTDESYEKQLEARLLAIRPDVPWSVKNQARMHMVNNLQQFVSSEDAIAHFPETATALGLALDDRNRLILTAPYGVQDLLNSEIRPTPAFSRIEALRATYEARITQKNWRSKWPRTTAFPANPPQ